MPLQRPVSRQYPFSANVLCGTVIVGMVEAVFAPTMPLQNAQILATEISFGMMGSGLLCSIGSLVGKKHPAVLYRNLGFFVAGILTFGDVSQAIKASGTLDTPAAYEAVPSRPVDNVVDNAIAPQPIKVYPQ